jgi:acyl-CoA thioester hydrolase
LPEDARTYSLCDELIMPLIYEYQHTVTPSEIDQVGHVNNIEYVRWLQNAAIAHSAAQGWDAPRYRQLGMGWVVRSHFIEYLIPAFIDDQIIIKTWVATMKKVTSIRRYEIWRPSDEKKLVVAETNWAFVNFTTHQPCRVPPEILNSFELNPDG